MIEGIVVIFLILIGIVIYKPVKDLIKALIALYTTETVSYKVFPDSPTPPINGEMWHSTNDGKTRVWKDGQWVLTGSQEPENPQAGSIWFY